jgi:arylsulfatase A-like enzyme
VRIAIAAATLLFATASMAELRRPAFRTVVLITVDTMRADHLEPYGQTAPLTPVIDDLAREAVVFERARATCPATAPSVASMLTGHHRATHGVERNGKPLPADVVTLAETLRLQGFRTGAVVANDLLHDAGFEQGFERFALARPDTARPELFRDVPLVKEAGRLLRAYPDEPLFLWLHMMAPHGPYQPPARYLDRLPATSFARRGDRPLVVSANNRGVGLLPRYQHVGGPVVPAEYRRRYAAEIRYVDDLLGVLLARLRRAGRWDDTLLVVTADHGESLGEHDLWFQHGWYVYDDTARVPLLVRAPGLAASRIGATVSLVDLLPTVTDLLGLVPPSGLEGESLVPLMRDRDGADRPAWVQNYYENALTALALGRWKYVRRGDVPDRGELYDVDADPGETKNLIDSHPETAERLADRTTAWLAGQAERAKERASRTPLPAKPKMEVEEALRALGYAD